MWSEEIIPGHLGVFSPSTGEPLVRLHPWFVGGENGAWVVENKEIRVLFPDVLAELDVNISQLSRYLK